MSSKSARHEVRQALADFQRGCMDFARGMQTILQEPPADGRAIATRSSPQPMLAALGPRKPAKRAPLSTAVDTAPEAAARPARS